MATSSPNILMCGTGEYTTGYVDGKQSGSDKKIGVVALCFFDMQSEHRGRKVGKAKMVGTNGTRFPGIREHFQKNIASVYKDMPVEFESFPNDDVSSDPRAFIRALDSMQKGDMVTIFTPDDSHFEIAKEAITRGLHVMLTKPPVKTLQKQIELVELARKHQVLVQVEYHKRFDPIYADARERIRGMGDFGFFHAYMSQPKFQLNTFKAWAGKSSDISYYLNSHHIDFHCWALQGLARPLTLVAMKSTGVATSPPFSLDPRTEDTITLTVQWENIPSKTLGTATYTASWSAPKADVHSQQRFFYMGHQGEISADQAHRGYTVASDNAPFASVNPLYMKYSTDSRGRFGGQGGYGYRSLESFVDAVRNLNENLSKPEDFDPHLPTLATTLTCTAILEAGRRSLDTGKPIRFTYENDATVPSGFAQD